ncbi:anthranilate phosphoribosyltransferase [Paucilactobacillus hokkaidonensis JCM 18461]|uniref:Anthranilate phosphoribosyltransferase n=2 Tax=Paucilactobacillus hokkaidonensis TaxID=1193095 RepID=A0A0A1GX72_9LACO|nr:anthranilate phosphoribosyltransferase [Paucilactobacillus hokkaidonensis]KRO08749.1 anthranilate phosphoribosyltransferase [Paucilactobacillus hokkaidonensis]BAP86640.1 anthranilate phosphoribosyltransferase [Paucilactobacillus hokkaidonensis JCM 18461]
MIETAIKQVTNNEDLTFEQAQQVMNEIMNGETNDIQIASFLTALSMKHETADEIAGSAKSMRDHAAAFNANEQVLEIVGTGGDHANTFNISTTSALVIAAAGVPVAKHGNRAASSKSGAADVLEALGVNINLKPHQSEELLQKIGVCFLFAQEYHQAMRFVAPVRKTLGIRTIFNVLGPLGNPAHATQQLLGVYDESLLEPMAHVLDQLGVTDAMIVHGQDGLDEISMSAPTDVIELRHGQMTKYTIDPRDFGFELCAKADLVGGTPADNAQITRDILAGQANAKRDVVLLNAGAALHIAKPELSLQAGVLLAQQVIDDGSAQAKLTELVQFTKEAVA